MSYLKLAFKVEKDLRQSQQLNPKKISQSNILQNLEQVRELFQERSAIREFDGNQPKVEAELGALQEVLPYIDVKGSLIIPLDTPPKYRWWQNGQSIEETLKELGASEETIQRWSNRKPGGVSKLSTEEDL